MQLPSLFVMNRTSISFPVLWCNDCAASSGLEKKTTVGCMHFGECMQSCGNACSPVLWNKGKQYALKILKNIYQTCILLPPYVFNFDIAQKSPCCCVQMNIRKQWTVLPIKELALKTQRDRETANFIVSEKTYSQRLWSICICVLILDNKKD